MKRLIFCTLFLLALLMCEPASAQMPDGLVSAGVVSKYMQHGFNVGDDEPNIQFTAYRQLPAGFGLGYFSSMPFDRAMKEKDAHHFALLHRKKLFVDAFYQCDWESYADFWIDPNRKKNGKRWKGLKFNAGAALPNFLPLPGPDLIPSYHFYFWMPVDRNLFTEGGIHELQLKYPIPLPDGWKIFHKNQTLDLSAAANYNTGVFGVADGWSHNVYGAQTSFRHKKFELIAGAFWQDSLEPTVNPEDESWVELTLRRWF